MSQVLVTEQYLSDIGSAIRGKLGGSSSYFPSQMASAIQSIRSAAELSIVSQTFSQNGTFRPSTFSADAFADVVIAVPNSYAASDEGKVVSSGDLVAQGTMNVSSNSVYDTTLYSQVSVAIPVAVLMSKVISENGTYDAANDSADGFSQVVVNVTGGGGTDGLPIEIITGLESSNIFSFTNSTISKLRAYALYNHANIGMISMDAVSAIPSNAFAYCYRLESVFFDKCEQIGSYAFFRTSALKVISFPKCIEIYEYAFELCGVENVSFPKLSIIGRYAFRSCSLLTQINASVLTDIYSDAFTNCTKLVSIIAENIKHIGANAFSNCTSLQEIYFPLCSSIGSNAFRQCYNLEKVYINTASLNGTFRYCSKLESLYIITSIIGTITNAALSDTPIAKSSFLGYFGSIYVLESMVDSFKTANGWSFYSDRITAYIEE